MRGAEKTYERKRVVGVEVWKLKNRTGERRARRDARNEERGGGEKEGCEGSERT